MIVGIGIGVVIGVLLTLRFAGAALRRSGALEQFNAGYHAGYLARGRDVAPTEPGGPPAVE